MFDIGWGEMVVIGVVALVAIGPKELPGVLRTAGHWVGKARRMAADFQSQFQEALREADVAEMKKHFDDAANAASQMASPNLLGSVKQDIEQALKIDTVANGSASEASAPADTATSAHASAAQDAPSQDLSAAQGLSASQDLSAPLAGIEKISPEPTPAASEKLP